MSSLQQREANMSLSRILLITFALLVASANAFRVKSSCLLRSTLPQHSRATLRPHGTLSMGSDQAGIVTMYHKTTCPFCVKATELLTNQYGLDIKVKCLSLSKYFLFVCMPFPRDFSILQCISMSFASTLYVHRLISDYIALVLQ